MTNELILDQQDHQWFLDNRENCGEGWGFGQGLVGGCGKGDGDGYGLCNGDGYDFGWGYGKGDGKGDGLGKSGSK